MLSQISKLASIVMEDDSKYLSHIINLHYCFFGQHEFALFSCIELLTLESFIWFVSYNNLNYQMLNHLRQKKKQ